MQSRIMRPRINVLNDFLLRWMDVHTYPHREYNQREWDTRCVLQSNTSLPPGTRQSSKKVGRDNAIRRRE